MRYMLNATKPFPCQNVTHYRNTDSFSLVITIAVVLYFCGQLQADPASGKLVEIQIETEFVPSPVSVDVLLPPAYDELNESIPLLIWLHPGNGGKGYLQRTMRPHIENAWASGDLAPCVVAAPVGVNAIDWRDGTLKWESFSTKQLLAHMRKNFNVRQDRLGTAIGGYSAGGTRTLRIALRNPELFIAAAAMAPGFPTQIDFDGADSWSPQLQARYGNPADNAADLRFWRSHQPPTIVIDNPRKLRDSGLQLLIEAGDQDANNAFRSVELLHRLLYDAAIEHDYHLQRGAAHHGRSLDWRIPEALRFLSRALDPPKEPDTVAEEHMQRNLESGRYKPRTTNELPLTPVIFEKP